MLTFVGLGLYDEMDITLKGLEAVRGADLVFAEFYTSCLTGTTLSRLEELYGKEIRVLSRGEVEENPKWLLEAVGLDVVFLCGGDAMISTTHIDLRLRAVDMGIQTRIIHAPSIHSAAMGLCGLQNYRFGKSATIPFPYSVGGRTRVSVTPYQVLARNQELDLHTLFYLDIQDDRFMTIGEGIELLERAEKEAGGGIEGGVRGLLGVGVARAGSLEPVVRAGRLGELAGFDFGPPLHVLVVPGSLHPLESEALVKLAGLSV